MTSATALPSFFLTLLLTAPALSLVATPVLAQMPVMVPASSPAHVHPLPTLREQAVEQQA
jgi:hypothetical protein